MKTTAQMSDLNKHNGSQIGTQTNFEPQSCNKELEKDLHRAPDTTGLVAGTAFIVDTQHKVSDNKEKGQNEQACIDLSYPNDYTWKLPLMNGRTMFTPIRSAPLLSHDARNFINDIKILMSP